MSTDYPLWTFSLAPDAVPEMNEGAVVLATPSVRHRFDQAGEAAMLVRLAESAASETQITECLGAQAGIQDAQQQCSALLFRLDRLGLLVRTVNDKGHPLASCIPRRLPPAGRADVLDDCDLKFAAQTMITVEDGVLCVEIPTSWARITVHDRDLSPLLHDLAGGLSAQQVITRYPAMSRDALMAILLLMQQCGLFDEPTDGWTQHDLSFHARTRQGYARAMLGKEDWATGAVPRARANAASRVPLDPPDNRLLHGHDPTFSVVCDARRSIRTQGAEPLGLAQLSEFLFRSFHERNNHRPYPSGGGCYPLTAHLAVRQCSGLEPALYAYDPVHHELSIVAENNDTHKRLLADAAARAGVKTPPQILVLLAARFERTQQTYGGLSYSLILKEVGAVFQMSMLAGAAMGLAVCPLGSGDSVAFSKLAGQGSLDLSSVGEFMLGSGEG